MTIRAVNNYDSGGTARSKWNQNIAEIQSSVEGMYNKFLPLSGGNLTGPIRMGGNYIEDVVDPEQPQDAATKAYVDAAIAKLKADNHLT